MRYRALVLDADGTLLDDGGAIRPRTLERLRAAAARGVRVMLATGRSELGALPVLRELGFDTPALVFNGAGLFCPVEERLLEHRLLDVEVVRRAFRWAEREDLMLMVSQVGAKWVSHPRDEHEERAVRLLEALHTVERHELPQHGLLRVTVFSRRHGDADGFASSFSAEVGTDGYLTWFPLDVLADQRGNVLQVVDLQPPCGGKGEALRFLAERYGIAAEQVVCVGDASNDVPMLEAAGLGVAMANAMPVALAAADRVIGDNNSDALADLVDELFP